MISKRVVFPAIVTMVLLAAVIIAPTAAARVISTNGATVFIGEENLDFTAIPSGETVMQWVHYSDPSAGIIDYIITTTNGVISELNRGIPPGSYYVFTDAATADRSNRLTAAGYVNVQNPTTILDVVLDSSQKDSVNGRSVPRDTSLSFKFGSNVDTGDRVNVELTHPGGGVSTGYNGIPLVFNATGQTQYLGPINLANAETGTYTAVAKWARSTDFFGKGFDSNPVTFEVFIRSLGISANKDTLTRGNSFAVTVTGEARKDYRLYVREISGVALGAYPFVTPGQTGVVNTSNPADVTITTTAAGTRTVQFDTNQNTGEWRFTIRVEDPATPEIYDDVRVQVVRGTVTITTAGTGNYYIGEDVVLFGTCTDSNQVYLFLTGQNLSSNGVNLLDVTNAVVDGNPATFTMVDVEADDTWSFRWNTGNIPLNAGSYTVYAVTEPRGKNNLLDTRYATTSIQLRFPIITATASGATVARGDGLVISGIATGDPVNVCIWIFGENYSRLQQPATLWPDGGFEYRFTPEDIANLPTGQYFVVVQHPFDNVFDVWASGTTLMGNGISPVDLATLPATDAMDALVTALDSPNVNDIYRRLTFAIEDPWILIDPIGNQTAGSAFTISGTTNLAAGNTLGIRGHSGTATAVMQAGVPIPTPPPVPGGGAGFGGIATVVKKGTGANTWSFDFGVFNLRPGHYTVTVESVETGAFQTAVFDVLEGHEPPSHALALSPGWNFVSVPRPLATGSDTAAIFAGVETDGCSVLRYDTATGQWLALKETDQIGPLEGFWIYSNKTATVPLNVSTVLPTPPAERSLLTGWNAVGTMMGATPPSARDALLSVGGQWTTLIGFDVETQDFETAIVSGGSGAYTDSRQVYPGRGYWLYMTEPGTLCAVGA